MPDPRVLVLSDYADAGTAASGGAGRAVLDSYNALRSGGIAAELAVGFGPAPPDAISLAGHDLRSGGRADAAHAIWNRSSAVAVRDLLARHDPASTVVMLHQWTRWLSPSAVAALERFPLMVYGHDYFWSCPNGAFYHFPDHEPCDRQPLGLRCLAAQCDRNGRVTKMGRVARHVALAAVRHRRKDRPVLLHLSTRAYERGRRALPDERHEILHNMLRVDGAPPQPHTRRVLFDLGYVGRLEPEKGVVPLAEAAVRNGWSVNFVGDGSCAEQLTAMPGVTVQRWQPHERIAQTMRECAVMVLPSLWPETWGLTVPEAMALGVQVLVSTRAGSAELVERFGGGCLFDPSLPEQLPARIRRILASPPRPIAAIHAFRDFLSPERHAERVVAIAQRHFDIDLMPGRTNPPRSAEEAQQAARRSLAM